MPNHKGNVLTAARADDKIVDLSGKPVPPPDLWDRMEKVIEQNHISIKCIGRPENSFTTAEFAKKFKLSPSGARRVIGRMMTTGKIKRHGNIRSPYGYYTFEG